MDAENVPPCTLGGLMRWLNAQFHVVTAIGFADFRRTTMAGAELTLRRLGITPRHVPGLRAGRFRYKSLADPALMVEMMMIYAHHQHDIDTFILISGDGDFVPVVQMLRSAGKQVIVAAPWRSSSPALRRAASRFFTLPQARGASGPGLVRETRLQ